MYFKSQWGNSVETDQMASSECLSSSTKSQKIDFLNSV